MMGLYATGRGSREAWGRRHNDEVARWSSSAVAVYASDGRAAHAPAGAIVGLCQAVERYVKGYPYEWPCAVITPALGAILGAIGSLLDGSTGDLEPGIISHWCEDTAKRIGWSLDTEEIVWDN